MLHKVRVTTQHGADQHPRSGRISVLRWSDRAQSLTRQLPKGRCQQGAAWRGTSFAPKQAYCERFPRATGWKARCTLFLSKSEGWRVPFSRFLGSFSRMVKIQSPESLPPDAWLSVSLGIEIPPSSPAQARPGAALPRPPAPGPRPPPPPAHGGLSSPQFPSATLLFVFLGPQCLRGLLILAMALSVCPLVCLSVPALPLSATAAYTKAHPQRRRAGRCAAGVGSPTGRLTHPSPLSWSLRDSAPPSTSCTCR